MQNKLDFKDIYIDYQEAFNYLEERYEYFYNSTEIPDNFKEWGRLLLKRFIVNGIEATIQLEDNSIFSVENSIKELENKQPNVNKTKAYLSRIERTYDYYYVIFYNKIPTIEEAKVKARDISTKVITKFLDVKRMYDEGERLLNKGFELKEAKSLKKEFEKNEEESFK